MPHPPIPCRFQNHLPSNSQNKKIHIFAVMYALFVYAYNIHANTPTTNVHGTVILKLTTFQLVKTSLFLIKSSRSQMTTAKRKYLPIDWFFFSQMLEYIFPRSLSISVGPRNSAAPCQETPPIFETALNLNYFLACPGGTFLVLSNSSGTSSGTGGHCCPVSGCI